MKKAFIAATLLLTVSLLLGGCSGSSAKPDGSELSAVPATEAALVGGIPCVFPLVQGAQTLNILAGGYNDIDHADVYVWKKYEEMTGVNVNWTTVTRDERSEAVSNALLNRQNIDLILRCKVSARNLTQYGESGLILDLAKDGLLEKNAPNCWAYLQSHPDALASVTTPDGAIYALPQINSGAELRVGLKLFVNQRWLDRVGMSLPTTTEEFYQLLKAFREQDANGNGDPSDEIPFCCMSWQSVQESLFGAFGLENRGIHNQNVDCDPQTGGVRLICASEAYRDFLEYANRLFSQQLLDNYTFSMTDQQWKNNLACDLVGVIANTNLALLPADQAENWVGIEQALEGPNGDKLWSPIRANFHSTGAAVLPATCSDPALVLRWLDYFWTDAGTLFYHMGMEGETFVALEDGTYDYAPHIYAEMRSQNKSFDDVVATYSPYPGGSNPTVEIAPYFMGGEMAEVPAKTAKALFAYGPEEYWPSFTFTKTESETLNGIRQDIDKYSNSMCMDFVTGARPLSDWDSYLDQLNKLNADGLLQIYQAAVDRYHALGFAD